MILIHKFFNFPAFPIFWKNNIGAENMQPMANQSDPPKEPNWKATKIQMIKIKTAIGKDSSDTASKGQKNIDRQVPKQVPVKPFDFLNPFLSPSVALLVCEIPFHN